MPTQVTREWVVQYQSAATGHWRDLQKPQDSQRRARDEMLRVRQLGLSFSHLPLRVAHRITTIEDMPTEDTLPPEV